MKYQKQKLGKKIPFTTATRKIKCLGINSTDKVKDMYWENHTSLKKEIEEDTHKWKHNPCSWIEDPTSLKCPYYPKESIDSKQSLPKFQTHFSDIEQIFQKFIWNHKQPQKHQQS